ncbi:adenylate/guanylate cyclase domain-containing protein [Spirosoma lituiforme]
MNTWRILLVLFFFLISEIREKVHGQTAFITNTATLKKVTMLKNKKFADSLFNLASTYLDSNKYQQSLSSLETSLHIYSLIGDKQKVGDCFNYIAITYYYQGAYAKAIDYYKKGIGTFKEIGYKKGLASALNNLGGVYNSQGNYLKALEYFKKAVLVIKETGDTKSLAAFTYNIGLIYMQGKDYSNAMDYFHQSYVVNKKLSQQTTISKILKSIGKIYKEKGNYKKAFQYLNQSLQLSDSLNNKELQMEALSALGELFYKQSDYKRALPYLNRCLTYANETDFSQFQSETMIAIGNIMHRLGKPQIALTKCRNGFILAQKLGALSVEKSGCDCLYQSYKALGNTQQALHYYEQANKFNDSLNLTETSNKIMGMEFQKRQLVDSLDHVNKEHLTQLKHQAEVRQQEKQRNIIIITLGFILLIAAGLWNRLNYTRKSRTALKVEKDRSEALLLNILPEEIAEELKQKGSVNARDYNLVSILFTDFKSFTQTAEKMTPQSLVEEINVCFRAFDLITEKYQIEKIKTIGDAYMAAGGIPHADEYSLRNVVLAGLEMQAFMARRFTENQNIGRPAFEMRLGIHAGPIVAGIVGVKKFQYDVWGDTVNTASRMESNSLVGKVNISDTLYQLVKHEDCFRFEYRGHVHAKGKGEIAMYFVEKNSVPEAVTYEPVN